MDIMLKGSGFHRIDKIVYNQGITNLSDILNTRRKLHLCTVARLSYLQMNVIKSGIEKLSNKANKGIFAKLSVQ